jgi:hypothetical protein
MPIPPGRCQERIDVPRKEAADHADRSADQGSDYRAVLQRIPLTVDPCDGVALKPPLVAIYEHHHVVTVGASSRQSPWSGVVVAASSQTSYHDTEIATP